MKTNLTEYELNKIKELFDNKIGSRKIAEILGYNRSTIQRAYKQLNLDSTSVKPPRTVHLILEKKCKICLNIKNINEFRKRIKNDRIGYESYCIICEKERHKLKCKERYFKNKEKYKEYRIENFDKIRKYQKEYIKKYRAEKNKTDINFKLKSKISTYIFLALKKQNAVKNSSCWKSLPYTPQDLRTHLESLFEPWMNWNNYGKYNSKTWDDKDSNTWTWQIDHIVPQSILKYNSLDSENFIKCWSLNNLRPLSSKINLLDGVTKIRHRLI